MPSLIANINLAYCAGLQMEWCEFEPWLETLCCVLSKTHVYLTLTVPLSTQEFKWVLVSCWVNL